MTDEDISYIDEVYGTNLSPLFRKGLLDKLRKIQVRQKLQSLEKGQCFCKEDHTILDENGMGDTVKFCLVCKNIRP